MLTLRLIYIWSVIIIEHGCSGTGGAMYSPISFHLGFIIGRVYTIVICFTVHTGVEK